jgi:hypothetical protein
LVDRGERRRDRREAVQDPELGEAELRDGRERERRGSKTALRRDELTPSVHTISQDAAEERQRDERDRLEQAEEADVEDGPGQHIDLVRQGDEPDLRSGGRHQLSEPQETERPVSAERREVR